MAVNRQQILRDNYEALMMAYAAGALDEAQRLIVGAHLMLTPQARRMVQLCETLGGALMNSMCEPVRMRENSLDNVLARLGECEEKSKPSPQMEIPEEMAFLAPLLGLTACRVKPVHWHHACQGVEKYELPLNCNESHAQCVKAAPSVDMPHDAYSDVEITLVLQGSMNNECGHYRRGDLVVVDRTLAYRQKACPNTGGVYMIVSSTQHGGGGLAGWLDRLFR